MNGTTARILGLGSILGLATACFACSSAPTTDSVENQPGRRAVVPAVAGTHRAAVALVAQRLLRAPAALRVQRGQVGKAAAFPPSRISRLRAPFPSTMATPRARIVRSTAPPSSAKAGYGTR